MSNHVLLDSAWTLRAAEHPDLPAAMRGLPVAATVPGCVHTDLLAAGLIPDPVLGRNEGLLGWVAEADWTYDTVFDADPSTGDRVDLVCLGLDTVAEIRLNGRVVGSTANMHRSHRFDVTSLLQPQGNQLSVRFTSALGYAEAMKARLGERPGAYAAPYNYIRKMACNFGWDWGPAFTTAGIWRPIGLDSWSTARLASVRPLVTVGEDGVGTVALHVELERVSAEPLTLTLVVDGREVVTEIAAEAASAVIELAVPDVALWWPRGYGQQALYDVELSLAADGGPLDSWSRRIGFRTVELDTVPDADGVPFRLKVNGTAVFVKGANWIPDDVFVTRMDRDRYDRRLEDACAANINLLRVWGGGIYESDDFYDLADERGLLVWQDFLFACAAYPEESPLVDEVVAEAREAVVRLAPHPSLILWNGNNENIWGFWDWDWQSALDGRTWGGGYYFDVLPGIVAELDPTRPYWPGSPYSGSQDVHPNEPSRGPMHIWEVWNREDYTTYRDYRARFVAEFGFQAPPSMSTLWRALDPADLSPYSEGMLVHQKAEDGNVKLARGLEEHFGVPGAFDDWHYLTQLNQARALQLGIEHFRSLFPVCTGTVVWQLNDCWPSVSWAAVDGYGVRKPLWFALRDAYSDRLVTVQPRDGDLVFAAVNDSDLRWQGEADVQRIDFDGRVLARTTILVSVGPRDVLTVELPIEVAVAEDPKGELIVVRVGELRALWFFERDRNLSYPPASFDTATESVPGGTTVTVTAHALLRDVCLFPDRCDPAAVVDRSLVTLLPGESATFTVTHPRAIDPALLTSAPVLRCVNDLLGSS